MNLAALLRKVSRSRPVFWTGFLLLAAVFGPLRMFSAGPSAAQEGTRVHITPSIMDTNVGYEFEVTVSVEDVVDLAAFQFTLEFIDTHLEFADAEVGPFLGITGRKVVPLPPVTATGKITFGAYSEPGAPGPSGKGSLAIVRFRALTEADTPLDLIAVALADSGNNPIEVASVRGSVVYIGPPGTRRPTPPPKPIYLPALEALMEGQGREVHSLEHQTPPVCTRCRVVL